VWQMRALWPSSRVLPAARVAAVAAAAAVEDGAPSAPPRLSEEFDLLHTQVARVRDIEVRVGDAAPLHACVSPPSCCCPAASVCQ
jgi:hypothetical protein